MVINYGEGGGVHNTDGGRGAVKFYTYKKGGWGQEKFKPS